MDFWPFVKKEAFWAKRKKALLVFLLFLLPLLFALISFSFQESVPRDVPVAVFPRSDNVSSDDLQMISDGIEPFSNPKIIHSREDALDSLRKEDVYLVVGVPSNLQVNSDEVSLVRIYVDGGLVPVQKSSEYLSGLASDYLEDIPVEVDLDLRVVGDEKTMSSYLIPSFLLTVLMILALLYVPYNLSEDEEVLDRLEVDSSWDWMVAGKVGFFLLLILVPMLIFHCVTAWFEAPVQILSLGSVLTYALTFVYLSCIGISITFIANFTNWGRIFNIVLMAFFLIFSSIFYPVGFFGEWIQDLSRYLPTYYSTVVIRGATLKSMSVSNFSQWFGILVGFTLLSIFLLKGAMELFRRMD